MTEFEQYIGARSAAQHLGISRGLMYRILRNGVITPVRTDIGLMVRRADVQDLQRRRLTNRATQGGVS